MVFYLKYRPQTLSELDNRLVAEKVARFLRQKSVPHAFLFIGTRGTGKTSTARIIAKAINCSATKTKKSDAKRQNQLAEDACGVCDICRTIAKGDHLDVIEIDAASNRGIDEIRDLREKIKLSPLKLTYKVYIIDEVHMLTKEAFNALLKTLEEPPKHAVFILATTEAEKVPETIVSRCVRIDFGKATTADIVRSLRRIVKGEKLAVDGGALEAIAALTDGSFREGAKILEELSLESDNITQEAVNDFSGASDEALAQKFLQLLHDKQTGELLHLIEELHAKGKNIEQFFLSILKRLEQLLREQFDKPTAEWEANELTLAIRLFSDAHTRLKAAALVTIPFELAVVEYCEGDSVSLNKTQKKDQKAVKRTEIKVSSHSNSSEVPTEIKESWLKILEQLKPYNHSLVGVLRSCQPVKYAHKTLTIKAAYQFHADRLQEPKSREMILKTLANVLNEKVSKIEVVLNKS